MARRRHAAGAGRRPHHREHQSRSAGRGPRRALSPGPVLSARRRAAQGAAAARAPRGYSTARRSPGRAAQCQARDGLSRRRARGAVGARRAAVEGQCAGAGERARAGHGARRRRAALARGSVRVGGSGDGAGGASTRSSEAIRQFERRHLIDVLDEAGLDKRKAADLLGISLASLYRKLSLGPDGHRPPRRTLNAVLSSRRMLFSILV